MAQFKCSICGWECKDSKKFKECIEEHLRTVHHMSYIDYYEMSKVSTHDPSICWKCGQPRYQMTTWCDKYPLPCWSCINLSIKSDVQDATKTIIDYYKEIESRIQRNKFIQYYLGLSDEDRNKFLSHSYKNTEELLSGIAKRDKVKLIKESFFTFDINRWSLKEYSERNKENIHCVLRQSEFLKKTELREKKNSWDLHLSVGDVTIYVPQECDYDIRHHSRYSILNPGAKRQTRKLRIGNGPPWSKCIKFYNTEFTDAKAILGIFWKGDDKREINIKVRNLPEEDKFKLKQFVFKNKEIWRGIVEIFNELLKYIECIEDSVFALNKVYLGPSRNGILKFLWYHDSFAESGKINLSIL